MTQYVSPCQTCVRLIRDRTCEAFDHIPDVIYFGENDHTTPYPGDNGIQYKPRP